MISLTVHYLIDAEATGEGVKLTFFNTSTDAWEEVFDRNYRPYFFVAYPLTHNDQEILDGLGAKTSLEEKRDLFTGKTVKVSRVELEVSSDSRRVSESFEKAWEGEVPLTTAPGGKCSVQTQTNKREVIDERLIHSRDPQPDKSSFRNLLPLQSR